MATKYRVIKVKGSNPESFVVVGIDFTEHLIKSTSKAMSESELRDHLRQAGATPEEFRSGSNRAALIRATEKRVLLHSYSKSGRVTQWRITMFCSHR